MNEDDKVLETLVTDVLNGAPTFSDEMIGKVREELLKASREAEEYYKTKAAE